MRVAIKIHPEDTPSKSPRTPRERHSTLMRQFSDVTAAMAHTLVQTEDASGPAGVLVFRLLNGKDLMPADSNGLSDPYALVRVAGSRTWRSRVCRRTLNPNWHQEHEFEGYLADQVKKPIQIKIFDWDALSLNDPIGHCQVDIKDLIHNPVDGVTFTDVKLEAVPHGACRRARA